MPHPYWPLFDLVVSTPRLTIRYIDDQLAIELAALAAAGIHEPDYMPFSVPWSIAASPDLERDALRWYWETRAGTRPGSWNIQLATLEHGAVVGTTNLMAREFPVRRWFETGSWLGRAHQGRGLGTEMRLATLHLGFMALDASAATTGAYHDNIQSLGVTRKLGYEPNGIDVHVRSGESAEIRRFRMSRQHFLDNLLRDDVEIVGDAPVRELLGIERPPG